MIWLATLAGASAVFMLTLWAATLLPGATTSNPLDYIDLSDVEF